MVPRFLVAYPTLPGSQSQIQQVARTLLISYTDTEIKSLLENFKEAYCICFTLTRLLILPHRGFQDTSVHNISEAARCIIRLLYRGILPALPRYFKDTSRESRNQQIRERFEAGESVPNLARAFQISEQRVHQILRSEEHTSELQSQ